MSLEQQIANLVEASNNLTGSVNGKLDEIDNKVDEATSAVPDKIKSELDKIYYVDATSGSNSNDGLSSSKPMRDIKFAIDDAPKGSKIVVYLLGQQIYDLSLFVNLDNKLVFIISYGATWGDPTSRSTLRSVQTGNSYYAGGQFRCGWAGELHVSEVNVETVSFTASKTDYQDYRCSLFSGASASAQVWLYGCNVVLNNGPLAHQHTTGSFGKLDLYLSNVGVTKNDNLIIPDGKQAMIGHYGTAALPFTLFVYSVGLPSGETWGSMVTCNTSEANSNVTFS